MPPLPNRHDWSKFKRQFLQSVFVVIITLVCHNFSFCFISINSNVDCSQSYLQFLELSMPVVVYRLRRRFRPVFRQFLESAVRILSEWRKKEIGAVAKRIVGKNRFIDGAGLAGLAAFRCLLVPPPLFASASRRFVLLDSMLAVEATGFERDGKRFGFARLGLRFS